MQPELTSQEEEKPVRGFAWGIMGAIVTALVLAGIAGMQDHPTQAEMTIATKEIARVDGDSKTRDLFVIDKLNTHISKFDTFMTAATEESRKQAMWRGRLSERLKMPTGD